MRRSRRFAALLLAAAGASVALSASAVAHVTVSAPGATRGGADQEITFRVPVEKDSDTVGLTVALPTDTPIASVLVDPVPGWKHTQKTAKLVKPVETDDGQITTGVSQVIWTADPGHGLKPGEYGSFTILAGQLPDAASITFRVLQTYADGSVVRWNEVAAPGSKDEPQNPAPVLELSAGSAGESDQPADHGTSVALPVTLSIIALFLAVGAGGFAVFSRRSPR